MKRLIRAVVWMGLLAMALWVARSALKAWIDGPEVTPASGGWPDPSSPAPDPPGVAPTAPAKTGTPVPAKEETQPNGKGAAATRDKATGNGKPAGEKAATAGKSAGATRGKSGKATSAKAPKAKPGDSGKWVVPNGTAEILQTHPVKAKLASRVYRVPGMPMYDRTVA
ncbi:MAG TPA: hypothetical protein VFZ97_03495, partial [Acidimicrobiales bacterium]